MFQIFTFFHLSLLVFSIRSTEVNSEIADFFPNVKSLFNSTKVSVSELFSKINTSVASSLYSSFTNNLNNLASTVSELALDIYSDVNFYDRIASLKPDNFIWNWTKGYLSYPCSRFNVTAFDFQMNNELFGQHIVHWSISKLLKDFLHSDKLKKPLILSLHGPVGCGKTLLSKIIVNSLYQEEFNSKFVHVYYGSLHFPHEQYKEQYRERLQRDVILSSHMCDSSVFIFEDIDNMVPSVIDTLLPFIYFYENSTLNSTKNIFLFLSNTGSKKIEDIVYDAWLKGISREDMSLEDFSSHLKEAAYNEAGGLQHSEIVKKNFIDAFVPFLPLEKEHVKQCIIKELKLQEKTINEDIVEKIANQLEYHPPEFELFSISGCKKIPSKVNLHSDSI